MLNSSSKPIQARITVELFPRGGASAASEKYSYDFYSLDSRLMALALKDYLLPVLATYDARIGIPRSDIGSSRDPLIYFPDRSPASLIEISSRLDQIRHTIISKLPDPHRRLF